MAPRRRPGISQSQLQGQWRAGDLEGKGSGDGGGAHWVPRAPVGAGGHLAETAPKGVTELTVQMGLSPVLVAGATRVPWWEFQVPLSFSGGVSLPPSLSFRPFCFSRRKLAGQVDRAAVKTTSASLVLPVGETQEQGAQRLMARAASAPGTFTSQHPAPAS